jgi:hypothetical protein
MDDAEIDAIGATRRWAEEGLGFNCTFVDDDMKVIVGLAQRAVLAGLATDFSPDMQKRFLAAAGRHRASHEKSLGRRLGPQSWIQRASDKLGITAVRS